MKNNKLEKAIFYGLKNNYTVYRTHHSLSVNPLSNTNNYTVHFVPNSIAKKYVTLPNGTKLVQVKTTTQSILGQLVQKSPIAYEQSLKENFSIITSEIKKFLANEPKPKLFFSSLLKYPSINNIFGFTDSVFSTSEDKLLFFQRFFNQKNYYENPLLKINFNHFNKFLDKNLTPIEKDEFLFSFFSTKKANYKKIDVNKKVSEFLLSIYDKEDSRLQQYTKFLSYLKENISQQKLDVFEHFENKIIINIDLEKASATLGYNQSKIINSIKKIVDTLSDEEKIKSELIKKNHLLTLILYSHQPTHINQNTIQDILQELLLKEKNEPKFQIIKENIKAWYLNYTLQKDLTKNKSVSKLLKI